MRRRGRPAGTMRGAGERKQAGLIEAKAARNGLIVAMALAREARLQLPNSSHATRARSSPVAASGERCGSAATQ